MDKAVAERSATEVDVRTLFPLELTAFEKYFVWDDRPEQPLTSVVEMRFSTPLNVEVMERAITHVLAHNPMLRSVLEVRGSRMFWVLRDDPVKLHRPSECPLLSMVDCEASICKRRLVRDSGMKKLPKVVDGFGRCIMRCAMD